MKGIICVSLLTFFIAVSETVQSQQATWQYDKAYGLDQTLCNGKKYNYFLPPGTKGHQYLLSPDYFAGTVTLRGKCFRDVALNYDILNQQLLLKYEVDAGALNIIEVSKAWLTCFNLGNRNFELLDLQQGPCFYQVLGEGPVRILYYWRKNLKLEVAIGSSDYIFSPATRDSYVLINGQLRQYRSKRSLIGIFGPQHRQEIKNYLRRNKIKVNKASDQKMAEMINFIGNIR
jgi:hypothetical protein